VRRIHPVPRIQIISVRVILLGWLIISPYMGSAVIDFFLPPHIARNAMIEIVYVTFPKKSRDALHF
jgi:hypothetical protein